MLSVAIAEDDERYSKVPEGYVKKYGEESGEKFKLDRSRDTQKERKMRPYMPFGAEDGA